MGFSISLFAVGPELPRLAIQQHPEGGVAAAEASVRELLPGQVGEWSGTGVMADGGCSFGDDQIWASTYGPVCIVGDLDFELTEQIKDDAVQRGLGYWRVTTQSTADVCAFEAVEPGTARRRFLSWSPESGRDAPYNVGEPLPFEAPYWSGEHDDEVGGIFSLMLGEAAITWIFGLMGEGAPDDEVQRSLGEPRSVTDEPMHAFQLIGVAPSRAPWESASVPEPRRRRWFGRRG